MILVIFWFSCVLNLIGQDQEAYDNLIHFSQLYSSGNLNDSKVYLLKNLALKNSIGTAYLLSTYNNLGAVDFHLGEYNEALDFYFMAQNKALISPDSTIYLPDIYINIGEIYSIRRSFPESIEYFRKAIRIYSKIVNPEQRIRLNLSTALLNLGLTYYKIGNFTKSLDYLNQSSELKIKWNLPEKGLTYLNIAKVKSKVKSLSEAEEYYLKSINAFDNEYGTGYFRLTSVYSDYGLFLSSVGRKDESLEYLTKSLNLCLKTYGSKHPFLSLAYKQIGDHYLDISDCQAALSYYQKALIAGARNFSNPDIGTNPTLDSVLIDVDLIRCLQKKSEGLMMLALKQNDSKSMKIILKQSLETIELILKLIKNIRNNYITEESRIYLSGNEKETYFFAIKVAQKIYSTTRDPSYLIKMYNIASQSKETLLLSEMSENSLRHSKLIPLESKESLNNLNIEIDNYKNLLIEESKKPESDKKRSEHLEDVLFALNRKKENILEGIHSLYPQLIKLSSSESSLSLKEIQSNLDKDESIVDYFLSDTYTNGTRKLYVFAITKRQLNYKEINVDSSFSLNCDHIRQGLSRFSLQNSSKDDFPIFTTALNNMFNLLIKPVENYFAGKKLIIIPDEEIAYLPFDAFLTTIPSQSQTGYENLNYLILNYSISLGFSSSHLFKDYSPDNKKNYIYSFSPDVLNASEDSTVIKNTLTESDNEINSIFELFGGKKFIGEQASEKNFKSILNNPAILHLALHSHQDEDNPKYSYLLFNNENDTVEDGKLYNYEIAFEKLSSPMVVLSSCNSGIGSIYPGEGMMSLERSFLLAGASSVVKTLWNVNDYSSSVTMNSFYQYLSKGFEKDEALRLSKIDYLRSSSPTYANPYYWAGFQIVGENRSIVSKRSINLIYILLFIVLSGSIIVYFKRRKISLARSA